jgi:uncharacterized NAD(P)/FAD-binding protein YdhS
VAIVGGGFSGLVTLLHLRRALPEARLALFERRQRPGPGVAYGACDAAHLLNVPAARMGAFPDQVGEFHAWLEAREPGRHGRDDFVERRLYGEYLIELAAETLAGHEARTWLVRDAIVHLQRLPTRIELLRASGATCVARAVVLAPGLPPARAPWTSCDQGVPRHLLASDPWDPRGYADLAPDAPVVVVGSGLTAVDVVLSLRRHGQRGVITLVSRNGRLPLPHAVGGEPPVTFDAAALSGGPRAVLRTLRRAAAQRRRDGLGWAAVLDAVRPFTSAVWQRWSDADRARFLRRLRPFWEIHRHRAPRSVLAQLDAMRDAGTLALVRGAIARLESHSPDQVLVSLRRFDGGEATLRAGRVFNCVGPAMGVRDTIDPLLGSLLREGLVVADASGWASRPTTTVVCAAATARSIRGCCSLARASPRFALGVERGAGTSNAGEASCGRGGGGGVMPVPHDPQARIMWLSDQGRGRKHADPRPPHAFRSRRTITFRPRIVVPRSALMIRSACSARTSTSAK